MLRQEKQLAPGAARLDVGVSGYRFAEGEGAVNAHLDGIAGDPVEQVIGTRLDLITGGGVVGQAGAGEESEPFWLSSCGSMWSTGPLAAP